MASTFSATDFLHPLDMSARQQLESVPLLQAGVKKYLEVWSDRKMRQSLLSNALRLGPKQLSDIYRLLPPICEAFGIDVPELYLMRGDANAMTVGHSRTAIIIHHELIEDLAEDEITAVLAHECGHILAQHILYRQMAQSLLVAGSGAGGFATPWGAAIKLFTVQMQTSLVDWYRKSELTADRAAVAYMRGPEPMQRALFRIIGVPKWAPGIVSFEGLLEQAQELDESMESASRLDKYLARDVEKASTHPLPALRIRELTEWANSRTFQQLMTIAEAGGSGTHDNCSMCGTRLKPTARFCLKCGTPVVRASVEAE